MNLRFIFAFTFKLYTVIILRLMFAIFLFCVYLLTLWKKKIPLAYLNITGLNTFGKNISHFLGLGMGREGEEILTLLLRNEDFTENG